MSALHSYDQKRQSFAGAESILGLSKKMREVFELMPVLAQTDTSVLITGETGTGKDMVAEAIHEESKRSPHPFIKINCGALPEALLESELFGHERGAFTGALQMQKGLIEAANGTTLFLDEIGELSLEMQVKLLRVLQSRQFERLGGEKTITSDVRIIAATNRDMIKEVESGNFREDLYYRIAVFQLTVPPLRERVSDIPLLIDHFFATGSLFRFSHICTKALDKFL